MSVPFLTFIDGFGLYRNAYRTLMGWYIIIAALTFEERSRRANVHPITLGPHGSNLADVAKALQPFMLALEGGVELDIRGNEILVCAFSLAYIGDMPQQNKNADFKGPRANFCYRACFAGVGQRGNLQFDLGSNGRYHWQTVAMRRKMESLKLDENGTAGQYATDNGLDEEMPTISISCTTFNDLREGRWLDNWMLMAGIQMSDKPHFIRYGDCVPRVAHRTRIGHRRHTERPSPS